MLSDGQLPVSVCSTLLLAFLVAGQPAAGSAQGTDDTDDASKASAPAQPPEGTEDGFDAAVRAAIGAFSEKDFDAAMRGFERAHALSPGAHTLRGMGMVAFEQRDFRRAYGHLQAALRQPVKKLSDAHRSHVLDLLARTRSFLGVYHLSLQPPAAKLRVDDADAELSEGSELWLTVGRHRLVASAPGHLSTERQLEVVGNEDETLSIVLSPGTEPAAAPDNPLEASSPPGMADGVVGAAPDPEQAPAAAAGQTPWFAVGLVIAGAAMVGGAGVTGVVAAKAETDLDALCGPERLCGFDDAAEADDIKTRGQSFGLVTDILLLGGLAVAATGVTLWVLDEGTAAEEARQAQRTARRGRPAVRATALCLPGSCHVATEVTF